MAAISHKQLKALRRQHNGTLGTHAANGGANGDDHANGNGAGRPPNGLKASPGQQVAKRELYSRHVQGSLDPKVFTPHATARGAIPRVVAIQRKRAAYDAKSLVRLLLDRGIDYSKDGPGGTIPDGPTDDSVFHSYLPLEAFDNTDYDERSAEDWLSLGVDSDGVFQYVPAQALWYDDVEKGKWSPAKVLDWNVAEHKLLIEWEEAKKRVWLPRIHVMFLAEDPEAHADRISAAQKARKETEAVLRYHLYVDSMPIDESEPLDDRQLERIRDLSINTNVLLENEDNLNVASVVQEITTDYSRTLNRVLFDINLHDPTQAALFQGVPIPEPTRQAPVPYLAQVQIPEHPFAMMVKSFQSATYLHQQEEVVLALQKVREECDHILKGALFVLPPAIDQHLPIFLDRFAELQHSCIDQRCIQLKEQWCSDLRAVIRESLEATRPEDEVFLGERNREAYENSKLKRFMITVRFIMQDTIFSLSTESLESFCDFIEDACDYSTNVVSLSEVHVRPLHSTKHAAKQDADEERKKLAPLFKVSLTAENGKLAYSTEQDEFKTTLLAIFDKAVQYQGNIPQLENQVMDQFYHHSGAPPLPAVKMDNPLVVDWRKRIAAAIEKSTEPLEQYLLTYQPFQDLVELNVETYIQSFKDPPNNAPKPSIKEMDVEIQKHMARREKVLAMIPETISLGAFFVTVADMRTKLAEKCVALSQSVMELVAEIGNAKSEAVCGDYKKIETEVKMPPPDIERLVEKKRRFKAIPDETITIQSEIEKMKDYYTILDKYQFQLSLEDFETKWKAISWPKKLEETIEKEEELLEKDRDRFLEKTITEQDEYVKDVEQLQRRVAGFYKKTDIKKVSEIAAEVKELNKKLEEAKEKAQSFNNKEALFQREKTSYNNLYQIAKDFVPYADLWTTADNWLTWHHSWTNDPFDSLDPAAMETNVNNAWKTMTKSVRTFKEKAPLLKMAEDVKTQIEDFRPIMPIVKHLRQPGMKDRHWTELSKELGFEVRPNATLTTMHDVYNLELQLHQDTIMKIAEIAVKEYQIEEQLISMKVEWETLAFSIDSYKDTGTYVMKGSDEVQQMLDDHLIITQSLSFSPFKAQFEDDISSWEASLRLVQEVLEEWLLCQRNWLYLEPIFQSEDISRQLPNEYKRFSDVNKTWKDLLGKASETPVVLTFCSTTKTDKEEDVLPSFKKANIELEKVQKGLNDYLENKRSSFARFYFLSDDELLCILSDAKNPHKVNKQMRKLFENIHLLDMSEEECEMTALNSNTGEKIQFKEPVLPRKNIENWLGEVEAMMKKTIRHEVEQALPNATTMSRADFIFSVAGQIAGVVLQAYWTSDCERYLIEERSLKGYVQTANDNLMVLVDTVRDPKLTRLQRTNLGALITVEVHTKDIVETLAENNVDSIDSFEWVSQLRAYWEDSDCYIKQVEAKFRYGGEYIGGQSMSRLVITPLTDRIFLTLTGAMNMFLGGAPAGPAGTGKTETVKDLAKALSKQCVVFNCQEGMDYKSMGKFFKGLANAGAWACFDEFNRIDVEVLSVVAQQVFKIQDAARTGVHDPTKLRIMFEGSEIVVDPQNAVFITMNPGYAGRTELPDNLKVLFRPVACMVPDYALIGEIRLFSFGYRCARQLAQKMVGAFRLSSEQLSSQDHYDFGMRAVNTVINAAGINKREQPDEDEDKLLLRALRDSNVPKFLAEDIKLFNGIISDLFPSVELKEADYTDFLAIAKQNIAEAFFQATPAFLVKMIQLTEVTILRHGLMTVGPTMSGKTAAMRMLQKTMTKLHEAGNESYSEVWTYICNPKSVTMGQLYGQFDLATNEWTDGVLCELFRAAANDDRPARKWVIFDGPVDALWIESMNTVLDENKKLCLVSGEIIPMSQFMNVWFEVEDLAVASPATVSRAGMIYMEFEACIGVDMLVKSWSEEHLPPAFDPYRENLVNLFNKFAPVAIEFSRKHCKEYIPTVTANIVMSSFRLYNAFLAPYKQTATYDPPPEKLQQVADIWQPLFFFCLVWGIGGSVDSKSRKAFDKWLRSEMGRDQDLTTEIPDQGTVYEYLYHVEQGRWMLWEDTVNPPPLSVTGETNFQEIVVTTTDVVRYSWLVGHLTLANYFTLCVGPTGTGKTLIVSRKLMSGMPEDYIPTFLTFSAQTSANQTQDLLFSRFDRRKKKPLIYGAQQGRKMVIFVDDINMPQRETYGAQPPIELLRQWMDYDGWYDRKTREFYQIIDIIFIAACGPPGGGRQVVTNRFMRHFNFLSFPDIDHDNMKKIFLSILSAFLSPFNDDVKSKASEIVESSIDVYTTMCEEILPRPSKPHYTFNLRDIAKVFQGVLSADARTVKECPQLIRMWLHECSRVYRDRLVDDVDRGWFDDLLKKQVQKHFKMRWKEVVPREERLIFGDYMNPQAEVRVYDEVENMGQLAGVMESYLDEHNSQSQKKMPLVMFIDAIEHVSRIIRIIRKPGGHALLLGVGGSGRQSLTKLAAFINDFELFQVEITKGYDLKAWREDEKRVLRQAAGVGSEARSTVFLITDTQIILEQFLEDVNNILNTGEVPNLFEQTELDEVNQAMKSVCMQEGLPCTKVSLYVRFQRFVKQNLHMSVCMSPLGEPFRNRLRKFPALVNCCTIDWFAAWPEQALHSVAREFFTQVEGLTPKNQEQCIEMCVYMHQSVEKISGKFKDALRRHVYVTPTSYLELLNTFKTVMQEQRGLINTTKMRMINGLDKLADTELKVADLQQDLKISQPKLAEAQVQIKVLLEQVDVDTKLADETRSAAFIDESQAKEKAEEVGQIRDSAQAILDVALPALNESLKILQNLQKKEIAEVGSYPNPPSGVKLTMKGVCIMFKDTPTLVGEAGKKKEEDYWPKAKARLSNPGQVLSDLVNFKRDEIPDKIVEKVERELISLGDDFTPDVVEKRGSKAAAAMCAWVRAMCSYHHTAKEVAPKKIALAAAEEELSHVTERLDAARQRLKDVEDKLADLNAKKAQKEQEQQQLLRDVQMTEVKLERAAKLIDGLAGEKKNWQETVQLMEQKECTLIGDVLCASGQVSYAGPFTAQFRQELLDQWNHQLDRLEIEHSARTSVYHAISDPIAMRTWAINGLPSDQLSMENAIILHQAKRWPLCIDPQQQANKWIRQTYKENLEILKNGAKDIIRRIETSIRNGRPVLLENVTEEIDTSLDPLLLQQTFVQGGQLMIKIGESPVPMSPDFKFFMTTKDKNPHYIPEVQVKVTLLNFFITSNGLEEQLLGNLVAKERADLETQKATLVQKNADMKKELFEIQSTILRMLSEVTGDILEDESLITYLQVSKQKSLEINQAVAEAEVAEKGIDVAREGYRPVAFRSSILYFCSTDLSQVDPMYQYSLQWFNGLFLNAVDTAPVPDSELGEAEALEVRLESLKSFFTEAFYLNINRSLFEKHKTLFSFILCIRILQGDDLIDEGEWRYLLSGASGKQDLPKPDAPWVTDQMWQDVAFISMSLPGFKGFSDGFVKNLDHYRNYFMCPAPHREPQAGEWEESLNRFQKLIVLRCLRPDKMIQGVQDFVSEHLGETFIKPPPFDLEKSFKDSTCLTPLIFVLSQGADPLADFNKLAQSMRMGNKVDPISLGQGQGIKAERLIKDGIENGRWIMLQNCHLATSWMPALEKLVESFGENVNPHFRLWLTSMPNKFFPVSILQNGIKMTNEPPKGMAANVSRSLMQWDDAFFSKCEKKNEFRKITFALCFFHACIQERRKFGALGWNIPYEFTTGDLNCCVDQIFMFLNKYTEVPFKVIKELSGEIHYGGRVTDNWDRRYLMTAISTFVDPETLRDEYPFSESGDYRNIPATDLNGYLDYISDWPLNTQPELFGLHENADITSARAEAYETLATILLMQQGGGGGGGGGGKSADDVVTDLAQEILDAIRESFNEDEFQTKYPTDYFEAMNTVLTQECTRFNKLVKEVRRSLIDLQKAVKGLVVMSGELDEVYKALFINTVPGAWQSKAYPSLKPLASWVANLAERLEMIEKWYKDGKPACFWISGFFFPQAFLTGTLQNYARKIKIPIDTISFAYDFLDESPEQLKESPDRGCYVYGTFIEGARWNSEEKTIDESLPKALFEKMPVFWMRCESDLPKVTDSTEGVYRCPLYKTLTRAGTLSTTGHSTNFVVTAELPTTKRPTAHWVKRGVAQFCELNY
ncbi:Dynein-1-beta heavy chain [Diplonema papillatum]|nr:Dynein-1-beta heavy chain [Diplonema papillatum]